MVCIVMKIYNETVLRHERSELVSRVEKLLHNGDNHIPDGF